jgi:hypothetical protein
MIKSGHDIPADAGNYYPEIADALARERSSLKISFNHGITTQPASSPTMERLLFSKLGKT